MDDPVSRILIFLVQHEIEAYVAKIAGRDHVHALRGGVRYGIQKYLVLDVFILIGTEGDGKGPRGRTGYGHIRRGACLNQVLNFDPMSTVKG